MPKCPQHRIPLKRVSILSLACPRCDYKHYIPSKYWLPDVRHNITVPSGFSWSTFTLTNCEVSGDSIVLTAGKTSGTALSPQITNISRNVLKLKEITKVKLNSTHVVNDGRVVYEASNDGGSTLRFLKTLDAEYELNKGLEPPPKQAKYNDLRIKITLSRTNAGDTSPSVDSFTAVHNYRPDGGRARTY